MTETPLDRAYKDMDIGGDDAARLRYYEQLAATELVVLLESEPVDDQISPVLAELDEGNYVLAFDGEDRLAAFVGEAAPYAGLPGRALVEMLAGQGIGLGLNFDAGDKAVMLPAEAVDWLFDILSSRPEEKTAQPTAFAPPESLPKTLIAGLAARLHAASGLAQTAFLAQATYSDDSAGPLLAFVGAKESAQASLAQTVSEALAFSGFETGSIDVVFVAADAPVVEALARQGLELEIPAPPEPLAVSPKPPGSDGPPKLR